MFHPLYDGRGGAGLRVKSNGEKSGIRG